MFYYNLQHIALLEGLLCFVLQFISSKYFQKVLPKFNDIKVSRYMAAVTGMSNLQLKGPVTGCIPSSHTIDTIYLIITLYSIYAHTRHISTKAIICQSRYVQT